MLELIDTEKVGQRMKKLDALLQEIRALETEKTKLQEVLNIVGWYFRVKRASFTETSRVERGETVKLHPFRTEQAWKEYNWLKDFPFIAISRGWERAGNFIAQHGATETELKKYSFEVNDGYLNNGTSNELEKFLKPFLKSKAKFSEAQPVEV